MERPKVEKWLRRQVFQADEELGRCKKIVCFHVVGGKKGNEIAAIKVPKDLSEEWITEVLNEVESSAHDDAEGIGSGLQTYVLYPFFANGSDRSGPRCTFRIDGAGDESDSVESEPATKTGLLSQMMRHNEAIMRTTMMSIAQIAQTQRHMISRLAESNEKLTSDRIKNIDLMEQMRSEQLERDLMAEQERTKQKMLTDGFEKLTTLAPIVVNKLAGQKVLPEKRTAMEAMIQSLIESITPEQLESLQGTMRPEQMAVLLEVFGQIQKDEASRKGNGAASKER